MGSECVLRTCIKTAPIAVLEASVVSVSGKLLSGKCRDLIFCKVSLARQNACSDSVVQVISERFGPEERTVRGASMSEMCGMNRLQKLIIRKKLLSAVTVTGRGKSLIALTRLSSGSTPLSDNSCPSNSTCFRKK